MKADGAWPHSRARVGMTKAIAVDGRAFRVLTVVDNWSRESVLLETDFRLTGESVAKALTRLSDLADDTLAALWRAAGFDAGFALLAVGGYGACAIILTNAARILFAKSALIVDWLPVSRPESAKAMTCPAP